MPEENGDLAEVLGWAGVVLLIAYACTVLKTMLPLALLQPQWLVRLASVLRDGAPLPLTGLVVVLLASRLVPDALRWQERVRRLRFLALFAVLGFLLLIPLQLYAGIAGLGEGLRDEQEQLALVREAARQIGGARSDEELKRAITSLPGAPGPESYQFTTSVEAVRARLLAQLRPQIQVAERRLADLRRRRLFDALPGWITDAILALALATGFAAMAQWEPGGPTLLDAVCWHGSELWGALLAWRVGRNPDDPLVRQWIEAMQDPEEGEGEGEGEPPEGGAR